MLIPWKWDGEIQSGETAWLSLFSLLTRSFLERHNSSWEIQKRMKTSLLPRISSGLLTTPYFLNPHLRHSKVSGLQKRCFGKRCFCHTSRKKKDFDENGKNDEFAFDPTKMRDLLPNPPENTENDETGGWHSDKSMVHRQRGFWHPESPNCKCQPVGLPLSPIKAWEMEGTFKKRLLDLPVLAIWISHSGRGEKTPTPTLPALLRKWPVLRRADFVHTCFRGLADEQNKRKQNKNLDHLAGHFRGHFRGRLRGTFRGMFCGSPWRAENREINPSGRSRGRGSLSPALCVASVAVLFVLMPHIEHPYCPQEHSLRHPPFPWALSGAPPKSTPISQSTPWSTSRSTSRDFPT